MTGAVASPPGDGQRKSFRTLIWAAATFFAALGVLGVGGYVGSSQAIGEKTAWRKLVHDPAEYHLASEVVAFNSTDGIPLQAWWLPAVPAPQVPSSQHARSEVAPRIAGAPPLVTVIVAHGRDMNRSGMLPRAAFLVRAGYNVLDLDLRDHGGSGGDYITPGYREALDLMGGVAYVRGRGERGPIVVLGYSYGAVAALHSTAQCPDIAAAIADSPFITPDDVLKNVAHAPGIPLAAEIGVWLARLPLFDRSVGFFFHLRTGVALDLNKASGIAAARRIRDRPILFISGEQDWLAPPANARTMLEEAPTREKDFLLVPGANHNTTYRAAPELYETRVLAFLSQHVPRQAAPPGTCRPEES